MIPLEKMQPRQVEAEVTLQDDSKITLTLRPYNLADHAWRQREFSEAKAAESLALAQLDPVAKIAWNQLEPESKAFFKNVKFTDSDDDGNAFEVNVQGYKKLIHSLKGEESFWSLLNAYIECQGLNGFADQGSNIGVKKKGLIKRLIKSIGRTYSILLLRSMDTRRRRSSN